MVQLCHSAALGRGESATLTAQPLAHVRKLIEQANATDTPLGVSPRTAAVDIFEETSYNKTAICIGAPHEYIAYSSF